jgi:hypothetical protein
MGVHRLLGARSLFSRDENPIQAEYLRGTICDGTILMAQTEKNFSLFPFIFLTWKLSLVLGGAHAS